MATIILLILSNIFMTFAWYGHLKFKSSALWVVILASWGIAFFEYCLQVPANRWGHERFSAAQLKIMQEVITLVVFCVFAVTFLREPLKWNYVVGFVMILLAVVFVFGFDRPTKGAPDDLPSVGQMEEDPPAEG
ncbi:DMT family protein [Blastopirellula sp. JC732]|uniref:DMT family protein n=1 Tax=Blastopirellula sediminis TaxID=2894196 RepID=A0A9X1MRH7_9BACT|nr:DMT family protein [Blastopirellula sediminis]MCC9605645.1 DMT family protein [Blastopirellula sediminis]MCC9631055.1 DMT family protein [Blastopirellula sediminis]